MIQAIVFLPLIGALIAGAVTLYGAHARNPSGDEMDHAHDHGHGDHAHAGPVVHDYHSSDDHGHDDHAHDDHGPVEPPASGSRPAEIVTTAFLLISAALSWMTLVDVGFLHHAAPDEEATADQLASPTRTSPCFGLMAPGLGGP